MAVYRDKLVELADKDILARNRHELRNCKEGRDIMKGMEPDKNGVLDITKNVKEYCLMVISKEPEVTGSTLEIAMSEYMRTVAEVAYELSTGNMDDLYGRYGRHEEYAHLRQIKKIMISYKAYHDMMRHISKALLVSEAYNKACPSKEKKEYIEYIKKQLDFFEKFGRIEITIDENGGITPITLFDTYKCNTSPLAKAYKHKIIDTGNDDLDRIKYFIENIINPELHKNKPGLSLTAYITEYGEKDAEDYEFYYNIEVKSTDKRYHFLTEISGSDKVVAYDAKDTNKYEVYHIPDATETELETVAVYDALEYLQEAENIENRFLLDSTLHKYLNIWQAYYNKDIYEEIKHKAANNEISWTASED